MPVKNNGMEKTNMVVGDNQTGEKLTVEHKKPKTTQGEYKGFKVPKICPNEQLKEIKKKNDKLKMELEMKKENGSTSSNDQSTPKSTRQDILDPKPSKFDFCIQTF